MMDETLDKIVNKIEEAVDYLLPDWVLNTLILGSLLVLVFMVAVLFAVVCAATLTLIS